MVGDIFVCFDAVYGLCGYSFFMLVCFSMIVWTPTVLSVLYVCFVFAPVQRN